MKALGDSKILSYKESVNILSRYGIPIAKGDIATSPEEAVEIANRIGYPVVLKVISPQIIHKTDANVLKLGVKTESELVNCYHEIIDNAERYNPRAQIEGVLVQEMIQEGVEVIVGIFRDQQFGPVILFGLGGIFVEVLKDISLRVPPITRYDAEEMIKEIKGYRILEGFRGKTRSDIEAVIDVLLKVSRLSVDLKDIVLEMDLNPIIVGPKDRGAKVVDARLITL